MKPTTKFKNRSEFRSELQTIVNDLFENYMNPETVLTPSLVPIKAAGYHFIGQLIGPPYSSRTKAIFCGLMSKNMYRAELISAGAGEITFLIILLLLSAFLEKDLVLPTESEVTVLLDEAMDKIHGAIQNASETIKEDTLRKFLKGVFEGERGLFLACWEALKLAGLEGRVFIEDGKQDNYVVELKEGYTFGALKCYPFFLDKLGKWEGRQVKTMVVDGFVESVSEIDQLLIEAHSKQQPMALISQGFSEEVISTLYTNFQKGILNVIPLRLMPDLDSLNVINDISVVCGCDMVSSLKGNLLTFVKYSDLPEVERIVVTSKEVSIENFKSRSAVFDQIKGLLAKRESNRSVEDIQNILDARIRSLSPNSVHLYLPEMSSFKNDAIRIKLDVALRQCKTLINYGTVKDYSLSLELKKDEISGGSTRGFSTLVSNKFEEEFFDVVEEVTYNIKGPGYDQTSALGLYAGLTIGSRLAYMLLSTNGSVQQDV